MAEAYGLRTERGSHGLRVTPRRHSLSDAGTCGDAPVMAPLRMHGQADLTRIAIPALMLGISGAQKDIRRADVHSGTGGTGNDGPVRTRYSVQFSERGWQDGRVTISERIEAGRRERRVLTRVSPCRVAAGAGRTGTDVGAGLGPRRRDLDPHSGRGDRAVTLPGAPARGRRDLDALDAALGELRAAGWPAPEHPDSGEDTELGGRDTIAGRLSDEVSWLRQCADWLAQLGSGPIAGGGPGPPGR